MAVEHTSKLNIALPDDAESCDVAVINDNMQIIDEAMPIIVYSNTPPAEPTEGMIWLKPVGG